MSAFTLTLALVVVAAVAPTTSAAKVASDPEAGRASYVLRFTRGATQEQRAAVLAAAGATDIDEIEPLRLANVQVERKGLLVLRGSGVVQWIHEEEVARLTATRPNDPLLNEQWALPKVGAFKGWDVEDGTTNPVIVAVADGGVDQSHPDLQGRLVDGFDFVNRDRDPFDGGGHGTHVTGIVGAQPHNRKGVAGLSWGAQIMPLKVCANDGGCQVFDITAGIVWAAQHGAKVVNLSLGGPRDGGCNPEYELAGRFAAERGVMLVAAAGNSGQEGGPNPVNYPAACDGYVSVGATDRYDKWAPFSTHNEQVDLSAPGVEVLSTLSPGLAWEDDPATPGYLAVSGTSMASPHVAALAALLMAQHPDWTPLEVQQRMEETSVDLGKRGRDPYFGAGRIDVAAALGAKR